MIDDFDMFRRRALLRINGNLLLGAVSGVVAWYIWPTSPEWWGFGALSIILGCQSFVAFVQAARALLGLRARERALKRYAAQGVPTKAATMASRQALIDAGMIDDDA